MRQVIRDLPGSKIREVANAALGRSDVLAFWFGESDEETPAHIREAAVRSLGEGETFYSHNLGLAELREALAHYVSGLHRPLDAGRIAVTSSGVNALMLAMQALVGAGDEVVAVTPVWPNLTAQPAILGARVVRLPLRPERGVWRLDLDVLRAAVTSGTRVLLVNSPNNPTGWTLTRAEQQALLDHCRRTGTWIVAEVFRLLASQVSVLGGGSGTSLPVGIVTSIASSRQMREFLIYWIALALMVGTLTAIILLLRSRYGLALRAIRDNELAAQSNGVNVTRVKLIVYVITALGTAMVGALIFLQKLRISPDAAFSVNDWTAFVIFITVIGGIGRIEGPIVGTLVFFLLRQFLADLGTIYLIMLGAVAIVVMLKAPKGLWGLVVERFGFQFFPLERRVVLADRVAPPPAQ